MMIGDVISLVMRQEYLTNERLIFDDINKNENDTTI